MRFGFMTIVGASGVCLLAALARAQSPAPTGFGLPGWQEGERKRILEIAVLKQDMTLSFRESVRYVSTPEEVARVAGAFAEFERIPEPPTQYDEQGNIVPRTNDVQRIDRIYHVVLKQPKGLLLLYLTLDRGERMASDQPAKALDAAPEAGSQPAPAPAAAPPPAQAIKQPYATVTLWQMRPDTSFLPYCRRTYAPMAPNEVPPAIAVLDALYATEPR